MSRIAVFFPGIGYTMDRPLLHFSRRLAAELGYEIKPITYGASRSGYAATATGWRSASGLRCGSGR